jgi:hypothetical protein
MHEIKRVAEESTSGREDGQCAHRGGNRADDIGSGKLGAGFALEFV